jgi:DNA-directed RNA polymerase specialized sigma subunit
MRQPRIAFSIYDRAPDSAVAATTVAAYEAVCRQRCTIEPLNIPSTQLLTKETTHDIDRFLEPLAARERDMINRHCGMSGKPQSYSEIGKSYKITPQRVYQVIHTALNKVRRKVKRGKTKHET